MENSIWNLLTKLKVEVLYVPTIPIQGIYLEECKSAYSKDTCAAMFMEALFTVAKLWKWGRFTITDEWIKKAIFIYYGI
jgi:hypothetical protein